MGERGAAGRTGGRCRSDRRGWARLPRRVTAAAAARASVDGAAATRAASVAGAGARTATRVECQRARGAGRRPRRNQAPQAPGAQPSAPARRDTGRAAARTRRPAATDERGHAASRPRRASIRGPSEPAALTEPASLPTEPAGPGRIHAQSPPLSGPGAATSASRRRRGASGIPGRRACQSEPLAASERASSEALRTGDDGRGRPTNTAPACKRRKSYPRTAAPPRRLESMSASWSSTQSPGSRAVTIRLSPCARQERSSADIESARWMASA
jgi:hypothetical protein